MCILYLTLALFILIAVHCPSSPRCRFFFFFFNDTATTEIYTLSLHDALPISGGARRFLSRQLVSFSGHDGHAGGRSEEHTSELQSHLNLVCRLLLEKKKIIN